MYVLPCIVSTKMKWLAVTCYTKAIRYMCNKIMISVTNRSQNCGVDNEVEILSVSAPTLSAVYMVSGWSANGAGRPDLN